MKKLLLLFLFIVPFALAQVDTVKIDGYTTGLSVKSALDKAVNSMQLSGDQTAAGNKTFSGNKAVFGTTTNDSVGVRGRLNVNNKTNIGTATNYLSFDPNESFTNGYKLHALHSSFLSDWVGMEVSGRTGDWLIRGNGFMVAPSFNPGIVSFNGGSVNASDYNWIAARTYALYIMNGLRTDGDIYVDSGDVYVGGDINIVGNYYRNGVPITASGSVGDADSLGSLPASAYVTKSAIDGWSTNLYTGSANVMRLGKSYNDKRFNNGAYSDVWNIDYVIPPYNLNASWLYSIEHRTDYFNDTLNTVAHSDIVNIDGTGTPIWKTNDVRIMGNEIAVNVGDLPDSVALNWSLAGLTGNKVILSEANKTAVESRFPMPVRGFEFKFGSVPNYTFPRVYSFFSDLTTNTPDLETAYHFYGQGSYPSYFGGNILTDGIILVGNDTVLTTGDGESIIGTTNTLDSLILAFWNGTLAGGLTESQVNALIEANEDTTGSAIIGTTATLDSIITAFWNGSLGSGSTWDSTYAYQRIVALETSVSNLQDSISSFRTILNSILTALDTCGCSADLSDNTPTAPPTSLVAHGGEYETQVRLTWTDPTAGDLDSIRIYRHTSNDSTGAVWIASVAENVETYTNTGRTANTTYWYWVKALDDSSNLSYFSNSDSATTLNTSGATPVVVLDFEENNLSEWSSTSGANLSASNTVAHTGTYSMRVGTNSYGIYNFTADTEVWLTFWVYLPSTSSQSNTTNYIAMFDNGIADRTNVGTVWGAGSTWQEWIVGRNSGDLVDDDITTNFSENTWHKVKIYYQTNGTTTSQHQVWIDDTSIWSLSSVYTGSVQNFTVGSEAATITNYFYIDDIKLYTSDPGTQD